MKYIIVIRLNKIITIILWINNFFIMCWKYACEYSLNDNIDITIFISEFIYKHNEIINIALLSNAKFENINIIINQLLTNYQIVQISEKEKFNEKKNIFQLDISPASNINSTISSSSQFENNEILSNFSL